jgi:hypothetical protein
LEKPKIWDPLLEILWERGARHEQGFVDHLKANGFAVTVIEGVGIDTDAVARTRAAMADGAQIIVQGAFQRERWVGRTDVLRRVEKPSALGAWSYEVTDTKLARETKGGTVFQALPLRRSGRGGARETPGMRLCGGTLVGLRAAALSHGRLWCLLPACAPDAGTLCRRGNCRLAADELLDERAGLAGLEYVGTVGGTAKAPVRRYSFPSQETELRGDEDLRNCGGQKFGRVDAISLDERWVDIKKRQDTAALHPDAVYARTIIDTKVLAESLLRLGEFVAANGIEGEGPYQAARDLLLRTAPRLGGQPLRYPDEAALNAALRIVPALAGGVFPIQGPPGAGKTHIGARMICALVGAGKTVGITANSHKTWELTPYALGKRVVVTRARATRGRPARKGRVGEGGRSRRFTKRVIPWANDSY